MTSNSLAVRLRAFGRECTALTRLAGPIVLSQVAFVVMGLMDTVMAGGANATEQAVVGLGVAVWIPLFLSAMAVVQALSPIVARHQGANDHEAIVHDTHQAVWLGLLLGLLPLLALPWAKPLLALSGAQAELIDKTVLFLQGIALGLPAALMFRAISFYAAALNHTRIIMVLSFVGLLFNGLMNMVLIEGRWGFPALGGAGCGWATGIGMWVTLVLLVWHVLRSPDYATVRLFQHWEWPQGNAQRRLLQLGLPMGAAQLAEVSAFAGVALLVAPLGVASVAAHQVALNFSSVVFMIPLGLSVALSIRVGQALGRQDAAQARFIARSGIGFALLMGVVLMPLVLVWRKDIVGAYTSDPEVFAIASHLMLFAVAWQLVDAVQVCANGALRGYQQTLRPMLIMIASFWVLGVPMGHHLARSGWPALWGTGPVSPMGVTGYWIGLLISLSIAALLLSVMLWRVTRRPTAV